MNKKANMQELILKNKQAILSDKNEMERIEKRLEDRANSKSNKEEAWGRTPRSHSIG